MRRLLIAGAIMSCSFPAVAQNVPRYDVEKYCQRVASAVGGSAQIENACISQEQEAYDGLKSSWASVAAKTQAYCDKVARAVGGTYQIMATCIEQESSATQAKPGFKY